MSINKLNYEEWMVAFMDNELSADEVVEFNEFIKENPLLQEELSAFKTVQFSEDETPIYDGKDALLKKTGAAVLLKKIWPLIAVVLLTVAIGPFLSKKEKPIEPVVQQREVLQLPKQKIEKQATEKTDIVEENEKENQRFIQKEVQKITQPLAPRTTILDTVPKKITRAESEVVSGKKKILGQQIEQYVEVSEQAVKEIRKREIPESMERIEQSMNEKEIVAKETITQERSMMKNKKTTTILEKKHALVVIDEVTHPKIYKKLNSVASRVEETIKTAKELKRTPITIRLGKRKLFTINK